MDIGQVSNVTRPSYGSITTPGTSTPSELPAQAQASATPLETTTAVQQPQNTLNTGAVSQAVQSITKAMEDMSRGELEFSVDTDTHQTVIKIVDRQTNDVIQQFPSEAAIEIAKSLDQGKGLLIRQKA
jgi:flagellar protein FlaG